MKIKRLVKVASIPVALGLGAGLYFGLSSANTPPTMQSVLQSDGYPVTMQLTHQQLEQIAGNGSSDSNLGLAVLDSGVMGMKGNTDEFVFSLTPTGKKIMSLPSAAAAMQNSVASSGVSVHMTDGFMVMTGPDSTFNSVSNN